MVSEMQEFYKNKTIFLTGGSGFLGTVLIEKLLRATDVKRLYVLMRPKRGKDPKERIEEWKTRPLFELLLKTKPKSFERVTIIDGDCQKVDLGISLLNRTALVDEVELVVHSAATVNFNQPLSVALDINTRATRLMLQLAKEMSRLQAFVHVSTAFSNCVTYHIKEKFYPEHLNCSVDKVLTLRDKLDDKLIDKMAPVLLDKFPNTYTYSKALAEQLIARESGDLPVCIFRPGSIVPTNKEPVSGWIDNIYGPIAILNGVALGVLRVAPFRKECLIHIVPADSCANMVLTSAWQTAKEAAQCRQKKIALPSTKTIYNYVPSETNLLRNEDLFRVFKDKAAQYPFNQTIWYPFLFCISTLWLYRLATILLHLIPGYAFDLLLRLNGQKPRLIKLYKITHKNIDAVAHFMTHNWIFETPNTDKLWECMSVEDQKLFDFDMKSLNWQEYWNQAFLGIRTYLAKEDPSEEAIMRARMKIKRLRIIHWLCHLSLYLWAVFLIKWIIT